MRRCSADDGAARSGSLAEAGTPGWSGWCAPRDSPLRALPGRSGEQLPSFIVNHPNEARPALPRGARVSLSWPEQAIHRLHTAPQANRAPPTVRASPSEPTHCPLSYRLLRRLSTLLYGRPGLLLAILLAPAWLGIIYVGSLLMLLSNAFFGLDEFSGQIRHELGLQNFVAPAAGGEPGRDPAHRRHVAAGDPGLRPARLSVAYYMARYTSGKTRALFYVGIMLPLWSSYLVRVYAWKLILAKEGGHQLAGRYPGTGLAAGRHPLAAGDRGPSLFSRIGTFIVFVYVWLPFMILPIQAAVEQIPRSLLEASGDLGATPTQTFRTPDPAAGPARRGGGLHLHLLPDAGDYIIPSIIGNSTMYIGHGGYMQQGTAGNLPSPPPSRWCRSSSSPST